MNATTLIKSYSQKIKTMGQMYLFLQMMQVASAFWFLLSPEFANKTSQVRGLTIVLAFVVGIVAYVINSVALKENSERYGKTHILIIFLGFLLQARYQMTSPIAIFAFAFSAISAALLRPLIENVIRTQNYNSHDKFSEEILLSYQNSLEYMTDQMDWLSKIIILLLGLIGISFIFFNIIELITKISPDILSLQIFGSVSLIIVILMIAFARIPTLKNAQEESAE